MQLMPKAVDLHRAVRALHYPLYRIKSSAEAGICGVHHRSSPHWGYFERSWEYQLQLLVPDSLFPGGLVFDEVCHVHWLSPQPDHQSNPEIGLQCYQILINKVYSKLPVVASTLQLRWRPEMLRMHVTKNEIIMKNPVLSPLTLQNHPMPALACPGVPFEGIVAEDSEVLSAQSPTCSYNSFGTRRAYCALKSRL